MLIFYQLLTKLFIGWEFDMFYYVSLLAITKGINMVSVGTHYKPSGKFSLTLTLIATLGGMIASGIIGIIYAFISEINPLLSFNILLLIGVFFSLSIINDVLNNISQSQNRLINIIIALLISLTAYYTHWVYLCSEVAKTDYVHVVSQPLATLELAQLFSSIREFTLGKITGYDGFEVSGFVLQLCYSIEFLVFLSPIILSTSIDYFCENCKTAYVSHQLFISHSPSLNAKIQNSQSGQYSFIADSIFETDHEQLIDLAAKQVSLLKLNYHQCPSCQRNSLLGIEKVSYKRGKEQFKADGSKHLVNEVYIDQETNHVLNTNVLNNSVNFV